MAGGSEGTQDGCDGGDAFLVFTFISFHLFLVQCHSVLSWHLFGLMVVMMGYSSTRVI